MGKALGLKNLVALLLAILQNQVEKSRNAIDYLPEVVVFGVFLGVELHRCCQMLLGGIYDDHRDSFMALFYGHAVRFSLNQRRSI